MKPCPERSRGSIPVLTALTALLALWAMTVFGAVPQLINFQGILRDGSGNPVVDGSYSVILTIYDAPAGGNVQWAETTSVTTSTGLFTVLLGSLNPVPDSAFNNPNRYLGIKVGADPEMMPRQKLTSVGYTFRTEQWTSAAQNLFRLNGNVGIGTANLQSRFVVQGASNWGVAEVVGDDGLVDEASIGFRSAAQAKGALGTWVLGVSNNPGPSGAFSLYAANGLGAGSQVITVLTSGNVGIGSNNPVNKLDVEGGVAIGASYSGTNTAPANGLLVQGNVGIGTASPQAKLHLSGAAEGLTIQGTGVGNPGGVYASFRDAAGTPIGYVGDGSSGDQDMYVTSYIADVHLYTPVGAALTASASGNVGIGITSPSYPLDVLRTGTDWTGRFLNTTNNASAYFSNGFGYGAFIDAGSNAGSGTYALNVNKSGAPYLYVRGDGKVGVGTAAPAAALHVQVDGVATATQYAIWGQNTGTGGTYGGVYGHSDSPTGYDFFAGGPGMNYGSTSSIRWKRNIREIDDPLGKLAQMRGIYFDWDEAHGGQHDLGMIAEEVGAVLPEIVGYEPNGKDATGMDYSRLTPLLVQAVNALRMEKDAEIESIREENARLRAQLAALLIRVQTLEQSASR